MSQPELLVRVVRTLDELGIDYMVTGWIASSLQGEPRATHDIDVVVSIRKADVDGLAEAFPRPDFYRMRQRSSDHSKSYGRHAMRALSILALLNFCVITAAPLSAQDRPDFSGVWRLEVGESRMIGDGGAPSEEYQLTWLVDHRDPQISVVVNVRDSQGSHEFSFRCTTDGEECVNELESLGEVRRMRAAWDGEVLVMSQRADTPHGDFDASDRLSLTDSGERLVFERVVTNAQGDRSVRQVFRKLGAHPSQRPSPEPLSSVELPPELDRVLREYEQHWKSGNAEALVALFTEDGFVARRGGWIRGRRGLRDALQGTSSDLRLRAVAYAVDNRVGYIVGAYGYGNESSSRDSGMFILTLRRGEDERWLIAADLDGAIRP